MIGHGAVEVVGSSVSTEMWSARGKTMAASVKSLIAALDVPMRKRPLVKKADAAAEQLATMRSQSDRATARTALSQELAQRLARFPADGAADAHGPIPEQLDWAMRRMANVLVDVGNEASDQELAKVLRTKTLPYRVRYLVSAAFVGLRGATWRAPTGRVGSPRALRVVAEQLRDLDRHGETLGALAVMAAVKLGDTKALRRRLRQRTPKRSWMALATATAGALTPDMLEAEAEWLDLLAPLLKGAPTESVTLLWKVRDSLRLVARALVLPLANDVLAALLGAIKHSEDPEAGELARAALPKIADAKARKRLQTVLDERQNARPVASGPKRMNGAGSNGGPLLLLEKRAASKWSASEEDYERVCDLGQRGPAFFDLAAKKGEAIALVLPQTGYDVMQIDDGLLFIHEGGDEDVWHFAIDTARPKPGWKALKGAFYSDGSLLLMDSGEPGRKGINRRAVKLARGHYSVDALLIDDERAHVDVVRLRRKGP